MRVGYAKLGRSLILDPTQWGPVGGDNEPLYMLKQLAKRNPDVEFVIAGRHSGGAPGLPPNVTVPETPKIVASSEWKGGAKRATRDDAQPMMEFFEDMYRTLDGCIIHLGQHGTSNQPIPQYNDLTKITNPQEFAFMYGGPVVRGVNAAIDQNLEFEPVWLCQDPRNYLKARDLKWYPREPVLGQYDWSRGQRHWRFGDPRTPEECGWTRAQDIGQGSWETDHDYVYSQLELVGVPEWERNEQPDFDERDHFGIIINENRSYVKVARKPIMREWIMPLEPAFIYGKWSQESQDELGIAIDPIHYLALHNTFAQAKSTLTTPASGSQWATAKPWEAFALGVVCFFHPFYDTQGHIIPTLEQIRDGEYQGDEESRHLAGWLRVSDPEQLQLRVKAVNESRETYEWLRDAQRRLLQKARDEQRCITMIEHRLGLDDAAR